VKRKKSSEKHFEALAIDVQFEVVKDFDKLVVGLN